MAVSFSSGRKEETCLSHIIIDGIWGMMGCPKKYRLTLVFLLIETTTVTRRADTASERRLKLLPRVSIAKNRKNVLHFFLFYKVIWQAPCDVIVV